MYMEGDHGDVIVCVWQYGPKALVVIVGLGQPLGLPSMQGKEGELHLYLANTVLSTLQIQTLLTSV